MAASHQGHVVFLCHAGENKAFVRQLVDRLEKDGLKKDQIFYDEISLQPGDELDSIIKVIESPSLKLFVFVVSKYCFQSNKTWIRAEWEAALENNKQIFPIWLDDNNDGFKAFGNLVREFSYKLRKVIAQRVNPQETSTSLPGLSERICTLIYGDDPTRPRLPPSTDAAVLSFRQNLLPDILPAKLKLEFVQKLYNQLVDKADALFDKDIFHDKKRFKKALKRFASYKATIVSIIPKDCFIFNLRFFQPCDVDEFYHDHFRLGPASLSAALTRLLVTDQMRAAAGGEELMVRVEVRYDDYVRVRRQLCMTGVLKATSVDNLSTLMRPCTDERNHGRSSLERLDLAITSTQHSSFTEWAADPVTRQLANKVRQKSQQVTALEGRLEMAKRDAKIQESIVKSLHREVSHLNKKDEEAQKVLMRKTEEVHQLQETNRGLEATIEALIAAKPKLAISSADKDDAPSGTGGTAPEELDTPLKEAKRGAPEELDTPLKEAKRGAPEELDTPLKEAKRGAPEELDTSLREVRRGAPEELDTSLREVKRGAPEEQEEVDMSLRGAEGGASEELPTDSEEKRKQHRQSAMTRVYCNTCGASTDGDDNFCDRCGKELRKKETWEIDCSPYIGPSDIAQFLRDNRHRLVDLDRRLLQEAMALLINVGRWVWEHAQLTMYGKSMNVVFYSGDRTNKYVVHLTEEGQPIPKVEVKGWRLWVRDTFMTALRKISILSLQEIEDAP